MDYQDIKTLHKIENFSIISMLIVMVLIFISTPSHSDSNFTLFLNKILDNYLFGKGYYKPTAYPFAAKVTNSLSTILAILTGIFVGIVCRKGFTMPQMSKFQIFMAIALFTGLMVYFLYISIYHQEFKISSGRSFGTTDSFHNNPLSFMFLIMCKGLTIYVWFRVIIPMVIYILKTKKNNS